MQQAAAEHPGAVHKHMEIRFSPPYLYDQRVDASGAVSYTHLDVYKRQGKDRRRFVEHQDTRLAREAFAYFYDLLVGDA